MIDPTPAKAATRRRGRRLVALSTALAAVALAGWGFHYLGEDPGWDLALGEQALTRRIESWGAWGVAGSIGLMVLHSIIPFPAEALSLANGMVFGFAKGALITWTGAMLGALLAFFLARVFGQPLMRKLLPARHWKSLDRWSHINGWQTLLVMRLIPVIAFNLINYAAGLTSVSTWTFVWTTGIGILPLTLLLAYLGESMQSMPAWAWSALIPLALAVWFLLRRLSRALREAQEP